MNNHPLHTPGPWEVSGAMNGARVSVVRAFPHDSIAHGLAINGGAGHICSINLPHSGMVEAQLEQPSEQMANALVMAAAPELLAAAERGIAALAANGAPNCEAAKELHAAVAKARGAQ